MKLMEIFNDISKGEKSKSTIKNYRILPFHFNYGIRSIPPLASHRSLPKDEMHAALSLFCSLLLHCIPLYGLMYKNCYGRNLVELKAFFKHLTPNKVESFKMSGQVSDDVQSLARYILSGGFENMNGGVESLLTSLIVAIEPEI